MCFSAKDQWTCLDAHSDPVLLVYGGLKELSRRPADGGTARRRPDDGGDTPEQRRPRSKEDPPLQQRQALGPLTLTTRTCPSATADSGAEAAGTATSTGSTLPSSCAGKQQVGLCLAAHARPGHCCYQESSYVAGQCHLYRQSDLTALCHPPCPGSIGLWGQLAHSVGSGQLCRFASAATCLHFTTLPLLGCRIGCQAHTVGSGKL